MGHQIARGGAPEAVVVVSIIIAALWGRRGPEPPRRPHQVPPKRPARTPPPAKHKAMEALRDDWTAHLLAQAPQKSAGDGRDGQVAELRKNAMRQARGG